MSSLFDACETVDETVNEVEGLLSTTHIGDVARLWRLKGILRCLKVIRDAVSFADRAAGIRQLARLTDGQTILPLAGAGLSAQELFALARFGIQAREIAGNKFHALVVDDGSLPADLTAALRLDALPRRPFQREIADGLLGRLTPFTEYQTATQKAAVWALLTMPPQATLAVTMPTGSGKSLLFQLGTLWWRESYPWACVAVIVPTIALAQDHERTLRSIPGLGASRALTSELSYPEQQDVLMRFNRGEVPILLLSPEMALGNARRALITAAATQDAKPLAAKGRLTALFVDEAHIIEAWGRSFRPDFQRLPALVEELSRSNNDFRVVLLSATVGDLARTELRRAYGHDRKLLEIDAQLPRYEFDIVSLPQGSNTERDDLVVKVLDFVPRPCIVYTTTVAHARDLYLRLRDQRGYRRIALFTGEIADAGVRRDIVERWSADLIDIVVATSAFGLGVDKQGVRTIIHACIPESPARYYQEIGRASRDGFQGLALCVWSKSGQQSGAQDDIALAFKQAMRGWLTVPLSIERWWAMIDKSLHDGGLKSRSGTLYVEFAIDAVHSRLQLDSELNRLWNMTLINLLQRAGALSVGLVNDDGRGSRWSAQVHDDRIVTRSEESNALLADKFSLREEEKSQTIADVSEFVSILSGNANDCMLARLFRTVEAGKPWVEECGRCGWCRSVGAMPPETVVPKGLGNQWPNKVPESHLPRGTSLIYPQRDASSDGLRMLIARLLKAGVELFVVGEGVVPHVLDEAKNQTGSMALVIEGRQLLSGRGWSLVKVPTAVFLLDGSDDDARVFAKCMDWSKAGSDVPLMFVSRPGVRIQGRPLEQIASASAPYSEVVLDEWARHSARVNSL